MFIDVTLRCKTSGKLKTILHSYGNIDTESPEEAKPIFTVTLNFIR